MTIKTLNTTSKNPVGAVNEVKATADSAQADAVQNEANRDLDIAYTKEVTGFNDSEDNPIIATYDPVARTITLNDDGGTFGALYRGEVIPELVDGWESDPHPSGITQTYFLKYNGGGFEWSTTPWKFHEVQIAYLCVKPDGTVCFAQREMHGTMPYQAHRSDHYAIGTYRRPTGGGDVTGITLASTVADNRRPLISECVVWDEDLSSTIDAKTSKTNYTTLYFDGAGADIDDTVDYSDIVQLNGSSMPLWNEFTGAAWTKTALGGNEYMSCYLVMIPTTNDAGSKKYRHVFIAGQQVSTDAAVIEAETSRDLTLDALLDLTPEFLFAEKFILKANAPGNNWTVYSNEKLTGTLASQVASPSGNYLSTVSVDGNTITGNGTPGSPLAANTNRSVISASTGAVSATDKIVDVDYTATGQCTLTVASAAILDPTFRFVVRDIDRNAGTNSIFVNTEGSETINGLTGPFEINWDGAIVEFQSDGIGLIL